MGEGMGWWSGAARMRGGLDSCVLRVGMLTSRSLAELGMRSWRRIAGSALHSILDLDSIMFQSAAGCSIKFNFSFFVDRPGRNQVNFGEGQITLRRHGLEG